MGHDCGNCNSPANCPGRVSLCFLLFLATVNTFLQVIATVYNFEMFFVTISYGQEVTTYYLIRHAEKDLSDKSNRNPHLTEVGKVRAQAWKTIFKEVTFDKIYSTGYHRTQETAAPTAEDHQLNVEDYDPRNLYSPNFKKATQGKTVLVVGHSNTTPYLANKISGVQNYADIDERIHGNLYIIQCIGDTVTTQLLSIE